MKKQIKLNGKEKIRVLYQVIFWTLLYFATQHAFLNEFGLEKGIRPTIIYSCVFFIYMATSVFNVRVLVPRYFVKGKYKKYGLFLSISLLTIAFLQNNLVVNTLDVIKHKHNCWGGERMGYFVFFSLLYVGFGLFFHFFSHWHSMRENLINYEKEKIEAELTALRAQINPHLLFNTLNNIYSMSLEKSDKTPGLILKLSDLMSYILYDCKEDKVNIKNEIEFVENYLQLEKTRFEDNIEIECDINVQYNDVEIAPLIFLPFLENAFKHAGNDGQEKTHISISLQSHSNHLIIFKSENSVCNEQEIDKSPYSGIGMKNITKRLEYLYPGKYELLIEHAKKKYSVNLRIDLS